MKKRAFVWVLMSIVMLCMTGFAAKELLPIESPSESDWPDIPVFLESYEVQGEEPGNSPINNTEFVHADSEKGLWIYASSDIYIEVIRYIDPNKPLIWYEAEVILYGDNRLKSVLSSPDRPGSKNKMPETIVAENQFVLAINDDFFGDRKQHDKKQGIVVRDSKIISETTYKSGNSYFPNLEVMALFPDGAIGVYQTAEHKAQDYIDMGATDVFSFGPVLIRDGEINPIIYKRNNSKEPRTTIGMIEPLHYIIIVVEGRHDKSEGTGLPFIAERMAQWGATQAFNLDGGQTSTIVFMGEKINRTGKFSSRSSVRSLSGMIGMGRWKENKLITGEIE